MVLLTTLAVVLSLAYLALQGCFVWAWRRTPDLGFERQRDLGFERQRDLVLADEAGALRRRWSVVIAARNEADNLRSSRPEENVLAALAPDYQRFAWGFDGHSGRLGPRLALDAGYEVLLIDDHSEDGTAALADEHAHVRVLVLPKGESGKKAALSYGIAQATGQWIATLDADVRVGPDWLLAVDAAVDGAVAGRVALAGPVALTGAGYLARWQALDFCGMMAITAASLRVMPFAMGNGANLAFAKTAFVAVGGYASPRAREAASGDDMVLLGKLKARFPGQVAFAKTLLAVAETPAQETLGGLIRQRWRWSAKTGLNHQPMLTATLALVWAYHLGLLLGIPLAALGWMPWWALGLAWTSKLMADLELLFEATGWFGRRDLITIWYPLDSVLHAMYVAGIGLLALLPIDYAWKGRKWRV